MFIYSFVITFILLFIAAILSAMETAITAASPARIYKLQLSEKKIKKISQLLRIRSKAISTFLVSYSIVNTVATTIATTAIVGIYGSELGVMIASAVMAILVIIFAEVLPKAITIMHAENILVKTVDVIIVMLLIFYPINWVLQYIVKIFCFVFRIKIQSEITGTEEVRGIIEHHHAEGNVVKSDRDMLESILDLRNITVSDIMIHRNYITTINIDIPISDIVKQALNSGYNKIPLWKKNKDNIIGILNVNFLLKVLNLNNFDFSKIKINEFITKPWFIPESVLASTQLAAFKEKCYHLAVVIDEYGGLQGIITLKDILEEIIGHIYDGHEKAGENIKKINENKYIITGYTTIRDINRELNLNLPYANANTIAGLLIYEIRKIPEQNEQFELFNLKFTIINKNIHLIKTLTIEILDKDDGKIF